MWDLAISLVKHHGITEVSRALGLNATTLKKKAQASSSSKGSAVQSHAQEPTFLELRMDSVPSEVGVTCEERPGGCLIQVRRADGAQMNIHHVRPSVGELSRLIFDFCG